MSSALSSKHFALLGLAAIFAAAIVYPWLRTPPEPEPAPAEQPPAPAPHDAEAAAAPAFTDVAVLDERPPFHPLRRRSPPAQPAHDDAPPAAAPPQAPNLDLIGIVLAGAHRMAIVRVQNRADTVSLAEQDTVGSWVVTGILADRIVISSGAERREFFLQPSAGKRSGAP